MSYYAVIDTNILVSAMMSKHDGAYLATGNLKHFPIKPFIVTARQMLDIMNGAVTKDEKN